MRARYAYRHGNFVKVQRLEKEQAALPRVSERAHLEMLLMAFLSEVQLRGIDAALPTLVLALQLAEPDQVILPFIETPELLKYYPRLAKDSRINSTFLALINERTLTPKKAPVEALALTDREIEVLRLIAEGKKRKQIARELCVEAETIKKHLSNIYQKLGASNKIEAIRLAKIHQLL